VLPSSALFTADPLPLENLSGVSFFGKLLVLPTNVRLDWKVIARYKHCSIFGLIISNEEKSFITMTPGAVFAYLFLHNLIMGQIS
jgi:hypothetical protein